MKSIIALGLCVSALLSTASPLGDRRALSRKHTGAPLARRFVLSSRFDVPDACAATGNLTTSPDLSNVTDSATPDAPITVDNSTIPADNSTIPVDNSTVPDSQADPASAVDNSTTADNTTATKRYSSYDFSSFGSYDSSSFGSYDFQDVWFDLCSSSGGDIFGDSDPCFEYGLDGFSALFADSDVCDQQDAADAMILFAKSEGVQNSDDLINLALAYRRLPRESVELFGFYPSTPYCGRPSVNTELSGIWNEQPEGVTIGLFGGPNYPIVPFGEDGSCPYGQFPDVTSCSCVSNFFGHGAGSVPGANFTMSADATPTEVPDASTEAPEPTPTDAASASDAPVETTDASASDAASSTSDAASSAATTAEISGDPNDPNGRR